MNKSNILFIAFVALMTSAVMISCSKEDIDNENLDPVDVTVDVVVDSTGVETCDNLLNIASDAITFSGLGTAHLFKMGTNCETAGSNSALNFHVVDAQWDYWGTAPNIFAASDGIPGFAFGTDLDAEVGDTAFLFRSFAGPQSLIHFDSISTYQALANDYIITLTAMGDEDGEFIGGSVSGSFINEIGDTSPFEASFCVPIIVACE